MTKEPKPAPEWEADLWLNAPGPVRLADLAGRVVALHAFQMLCPGCAAHGIPQAQRIHELFGQADVSVVGLHTVFEHHEAMTPVALKAFVHEYRLTFPIGVDRPGQPGPLPVTMARYAMRGTPTLILIDRRGRLRQHAFGQVEDMAVGASIATLLAEPS